MNARTLRKIRNRIRWALGPGIVYIALILAATVYTTVGKAQAVDRLDATSSLFLEYGAWGTGTSTAVVGDTVIQTESAEARVAVTKSQPAADTNQAVWTQTSASGQTIANAGVLTASTSGVLIIHGNFTGIVLATGDSITFTATLQQT